VARFVILIAAAAVLAGCGGGSGGSKPATGAASTATAAQTAPAKPKAAAKTKHGRAAKSQRTQGKSKAATPVKRSGASGAAFVNGLDGICAESNRYAKLFAQRVNAISRGSKSPAQGFERLTLLFGASVGEFDRLRTRYGRLHPPAADRSFYSQYGSVLAETVSITGQLQAAARKRDPSRLKSLGGRLARLKVRRDRLTSGHGGFKVCGA
jgi:hypothetical protein